MCAAKSLLYKLDRCAVPVVLVHMCGAGCGESGESGESGEMRECVVAEYHAVSGELMRSRSVEISIEMERAEASVRPSSYHIGSVRTY